MEPAWTAGGWSLFRQWRRIRTHLTGAHLGGGGAPRRPFDDEPPLRAELFSIDQMEQHGVRLASAHRLMPGRVPDQLLSRLAVNEGVLVETCDRQTAAVAAGHRITPAGEWLLDNFYLVEEQIRTARRHLPKGYSRELPALAEGASAGLPRVYDIALETIAHGDGRVDPGSLSRFVAAYQSVAPLRLGELWAIPIMLRLALIENLRRVAVRIASGRADRDLAVVWANKPDGHRPPGSKEPDPGDCGHGALGSTHDQPVRVGDRTPPAGAGARPGLAADLDRAAAGGVGPEHRAAGSLGKPAAGRRPGLHQQQHRQSAVSRDHGLARVRRGHEPGRKDPALGPGCRLRRHGFRQP